MNENISDQITYLYKFFHFLSMNNSQLFITIIQNDPFYQDKGLLIMNNSHCNLIVMYNDLKYLDISLTNVSIASICLSNI